MRVRQGGRAAHALATKGAMKRSDSRKAEPVTMDAKPVRAPASTPVLLSM
jgi:hypothetical protein